MKTIPSWMTTVLRLAAIYNLVWGSIVVLNPSLLFNWADIVPPRYPELWQCIGMIVGVYGIGYWIAAHDPFRHWPIVFVGLLGKVFGPIGFVMAVFRGSLPLSFGITIFMNDLIWWLPFGVILWQAMRSLTDPELIRGSENTSMSAMSSLVGDNGKTLREMSFDGPVLTVFLRHAGCTFHRQALSDLKGVEADVAREGIQVALVHMSKGANPCEERSDYRLSHVVHFSDPHCDLYREFGLERGSFLQLLGPRVWCLGLSAFMRGHGIGRLAGDGFQMPGVFLLNDGQVVHQYRHQTSGDRPNYLRIARSIC